MAEIHTLKFGPQLLEDAEAVCIRISLNEAARDAQTLIDRYGRKDAVTCGRLACLLGYIAQARHELDKLEGRG